MRYVQRNSQSGHYEIYYPEEISFAYNYNHIEIQCSDKTPFNFDIVVEDPTGFVETRIIKAASYNGEVTIGVSLMMQLIFHAPESIRSKRADFSIKRGEETIFTFSTLVLYSAISMGERIQTLGTYPEGSVDHYERHITWFANFPFTFDFLGLSGYEYYERQDSSPYGASHAVSEGIISNTINPNVKSKYILKLKKIPNVSTSTFDDTFDYTFFKLGKEDSLYIFERCDHKCGYYFRWIDRRGFMMYYLFSKGNRESQTEQNEAKRYEYNGIYQSERVLSIDTEQTISCCATSLDSEHYDDVASIASAAYVDLFLGYKDDLHHTPIWIPCNVSSASHIKDERRELNDFEIQVKFKETSQGL